MNPRQPPIPPEMQIYVNCMEKVKQRIGVVNWAVASVHVFQQDHFIFAELIFVQFRKILELIAYSSLSANKEKYAEANAKFAEHWKAVRMLDALEKINPHFYPVPVEVTQKAGTKLLTPITDGFLTKEEFARLYDASSDILHMRNPFSAKDPTFQIGYSVQDWVARIQRLLRLHFINLVDQDEKWVVEIPADGPPKVFRGVANQDGDAAK
jgi:hypothetical protein